MGLKEISKEVVLDLQRKINEVHLRHANLNIFLPLLFILLLLVLNKVFLIVWTSKSL